MRTTLIHSPYLSWEEKRDDITTLMIHVEEGGHKEIFGVIVAVRIV